MTGDALHVFLSGALTCVSVIAGLFFMKYWTLSRDRFFLFFAAAFWIMAVNWTAIATIAPSQETRHYFYVVRLIAFLLILAAIVDKNRHR
jgi:hypothetical protein